MVDIRTFKKSMKKGSRKLVITTSVLIFASTGGLAVRAATLFQSGYISPSFSVKNYNLNDVWNTALAQVIPSWNGTPTKAFISLSSNSNNEIYGGNYDASWYGMYYKLEDDGYGSAKKFSIAVNGNAIIIAQSRGEDTTNYLRSTLAHELGHALHLGDLDNTSKELMNHNRDRSEIYTPQSGDIQGVNSYWK